MTTKPTDKAIRYAIAQFRKGRDTSAIAADIHMSQRHVQRFCAEFRRTGAVHTQKPPGRPKSTPQPDIIKAVLKEYEKNQGGVMMTARILRKNHDISYHEVCRIMKDNWLAVPSKAKSKRRKCVRWERTHSNSLWHTDWHEMKDERFCGFKLITYPDDASRCVTAARVFKEATSENAVLVLREAMERFGTPAAILSDNGSCFVGAGNGRQRKQRRADSKIPTETWTSTAFEAELLDHGIELINSRPYHPQTSGKLARFHRSLEEEMGRFESLSAYIKYYNEERIHWSLDIDNYETPILAFENRAVTEAVRKNNPKWMEKDPNGTTE